MHIPTYTFTNNQVSVNYRLSKILMLVLEKVEWSLQQFMKALDNLSVTCVGLISSAGAFIDSIANHHKVDKEKE